jgi:uncharacterized damage-inducible protein DinB
MDPYATQEFFRHNTWANTRMLEIAASLTLDQFACDLGGSFPSVQATLTHIMWAEWLWLERWTGGSPTDVFRPQDFRSIPEIESRWRQIQIAQKRFVDFLTSGALQQVVRYVNLKGETWEYPLWRQMYHMVNHSSHHRGQVTHKFRQLGIAPRAADFLNFCDEAE